MEYVRDNRLIGNKSKGTPPSEQINSFGRRQQAEWMLTANENREDVLGLRTIRSIGYLQETQSWNLDGNFDRVSAMNMVFILRADRYKNTQTSKNREDEDEWENDPFFKDNYSASIESSFSFDF